MAAMVAGEVAVAEAVTAVAAVATYGNNHTLLAKRLIARSSWFCSLPFWPLKANEKQVDVSWRELVDF